MSINEAELSQGNGTADTLPQRSPFSYFEPTEQAKEITMKLREAYKILHQTLAVLPRNREMSVAITELETSAMWAIKSIVFNDRASVEK